MARAARGGQGRRPDGAAHPRPRQGRQGAGAAGAAAGARAVRPRRARPARSRRALFAAVAQVLAYVYQLRAAMARPRRRCRPSCPRPTVPPELDPHARRAGAPTPELTHERADAAACRRCSARSAGAAARRWRAPVFVVMVLAMMVLPLPPFVLDLLFTFNIALALMVMMVAALHGQAAGLRGLPDRAAGDHAAAPVAQRGLHPRGAAGRPHRPGRGRAR